MFLFLLLLLPLLLLHHHHCHHYHHNQRYHFHHHHHHHYECYHYKEEENRHITSTLKECGYPKWAIDQALKPKKPSCRRTEPASGLSPHSVAVPYIKGVAEKTQRIFKSAGVRSYLGPAQKIKQILFRPKDPIPPEDACDVVYHIKCDGSEANDESPCSESYIGETERSLRSRFLGHRRPSSIHSEVSSHINRDKPSHSVSLASAKILDREDDWFARGVREAIHIRAHRPRPQQRWWAVPAPSYLGLIN